MKIGLHDAEKDYFKTKKTFPNYALMKISAWHKQQGDQAEWWNPLYQYDRVYSSKIFDFTPVDPYLPEETIRGGIGYLTRGCIRNCLWCIVPKKEGQIRPYRTWRELTRPDTDKLVLMDNNILACDHGISQLENMIGSGYKIDLNQGMDARLVNDYIAEILSRLNWIRHIRFSCDQKSQIEPIRQTLELLSKYGVKPYRIFIYLLVTKDIQDAVERVETLKEYKGINLYAQAERNERLGIMPNKAQLEFQQIYIYGGCYRKEKWEEYCRRKGFSFPEEMT